MSCKSSSRARICLQWAQMLKHYVENQTVLCLWASVHCCVCVLDRKQLAICERVAFRHTGYVYQYLAGICVPFERKPWPNWARLILAKKMVYLHFPKAWTCQWGQVQLNQSFFISASWHPHVSWTLGGHRNKLQTIKGGETHSLDMEEIFRNSTS